MPWIQAHLTTSKEQAPLIELLFENLGALSTTLEDAEDEPLLEPKPGEAPIWKVTRITGLFDGDINSDELRNQINHTLNSDVTPTLELEVLEDQEWERAWLDNFHAMSFGSRLWICPQGKQPDQEGAVVVELDPGLAFGTGTHPTTGLCLQWLDRTPLEGLELIDFGCGSGILAVAALKLGAQRVYATDHDPQAMQASEANAIKNRVSDRLQLCGSSEQLPPRPVDIVLANILAGTLVELEEHIASLTKTGGRVVLSGILSEQAERVSNCYTSHFDMAPPIQQEEWILLEGVKR
ncbi:MAG: 50S ribosomal protein L11 methyltransferase [Sedimenticola sp.]|nr:50S ribosomal protein L11 methyltransferase [Sedimenticola sp.]MCW8974920.1 50S ribosomal protein L11 methyltransferase [Sedimenticola sp.]MCW9022873.1 50S ribosomal protein L11 methyltransferase [Sedimenticola sp.]